MKFPIVNPNLLLKDIVVSEILKENADAEYLQMMTNLSGRAILHPELSLQAVGRNLNEDEKKEFIFISKSFKNKNFIDFLFKTNLSICITAEKEGNLFSNSIGIGIPVFKEAKFIRWKNDSENFEILSRKVLISLDELNKILEEYFSSGKERKKLEKEREKKNNQLEKKALKELNKKYREEAINRDKEVKENAKKRWPEVKKKIDEMNRRVAESYH